MSEQSRALEYRRQQQAREDNRLAREQALAGDPEAKAALDAATAPLLPWQGWDPERRIIRDVKGQEISHDPD